MNDKTKSEDGVQLICELTVSCKIGDRGQFAHKLYSITGASLPGD